MDTEGRLAMLSFADPEAARFVVFLTEEQVRYSWQLIEPQGARLTKGAAAVRLMQILKPTRWIGKLCSPRPLTWLVGAFDHLISISRPKLSKIVPKGPGPRRWP